MKNNMINAIPVAEVAHRFAVSPRTVRRLIDAGELEAVRIGATLVVPLKALPAGLGHLNAGELPLMTITDVAAALGCSPRMVRRLTTDGQLTAVHIGRSTRWSAAEISAFGKAGCND